MTSNFVLKWEIINATATLATGKAESGVIDKGGFKWNTAVERLDDDWTKFSLRCDAVHSVLWKCEAEVNMIVLSVNGIPYNTSNKELHCFDANNCIWVHKPHVFWSSLEHRERCNANDKVTVKFHINIISSERCELIPGLEKFTSPNRKSNVILKIGERRLHVMKELLALHSPVLDTLLFGNFAENGKEEVELKDVDCEEYIDLLNVIYFETDGITDRTVPHILKLADQFQMERMLVLSEKHLTHSTGFDVAAKLFFADQFRLVNLKEYCFNSFTSVAEVFDKLKSSPQFANYSSDMKADILERSMMLKLQ